MASLTTALCLAGAVAVSAQPQVDASMVPLVPLAPMEPMAATAPWAVVPTAARALVPPVPQTRPAGPLALATDPPSRVARLADVTGLVWFYSPHSGEWVSAVRNRPVTSADRIGTEGGARAELQLGSATVRLDADTELEVRTLDDNRFVMFLHQGSVAVLVRDDAQAREIEIATDTGRFDLQRAGTYRVDRKSGASGGTGMAGASVVTVLAGQARYEGPNSGLTIAPGRRAEFWLNAAGAAQYRLDNPAIDAFAAWNRERDRLVERSDSVATARYVSPAMTGADELDRYGRWDNDADYGPIWTPRGVDARWAPYSAGHWAWVQPWGWTWIDDAPWGFAPFHYGRWVQRSSSWFWVPGQRVLRPVYAPALVAWVGGPGVQVSIAIGGQRRQEPVVGWFPLAPREVFVPGYRSSPAYIQNINITHVTNVTQITQVINNPQAPREFRNRLERNAVTVVPAAVISNRQPVAPAAAQLRDGPQARELLTLVPDSSVQTLAPVAAPVAAPPAAPRREEARGIAPAPGGVGPQPLSAPAAAPRREERRGEDRREERRGEDRREIRNDARAPVAASAAAPSAPLLPQAAPVPAGPRREDGRREEGRGEERRDGRSDVRAPGRLDAPVDPRGNAPAPGGVGPQPLLRSPAPAPQDVPAGRTLQTPRPAEVTRSAPSMGPVAPLTPPPSPPPPTSATPATPVAPVAPIALPARPPAAVRPAGPESPPRPDVRSPGRVESPREGQREDKRGEDKRGEPRDAH